MQGRLDRATAVVLAVALPAEPLDMFHFCAGHGYIGRAYRLIGGAPGWSGYARYGYGNVGPQGGAHTPAHLQGAFGADRPVPADDRGGYTQQGGLYRIVIGDHPAEEICRSAGHRSKLGSQQATCARLGHCQRQAFLSQEPAHRGRARGMLLLLLLL